MWESREALAIGNRATLMGGIRLPVEALAEVMSPALTEVHRMAGITIATVSVPTPLGTITRIVFYNPATGLYETTPPTVSLGATIGCTADGKNTSPYTQNMRMDCEVRRPDGTTTLLGGDLKSIATTLTGMWTFTVTAAMPGDYKVTLILYAEYAG